MQLDIYKKYYMYIYYYTHTHAHTHTHTHIYIYIYIYVCVVSSIGFQHKRFKEGRETVRDDGRSKEVNRTELIGQWIMVSVRVTTLRF